MLKQEARPLIDFNPIGSWSRSRPDYCVGRVDETPLKSRSDMWNCATAGSGVVVDVLYGRRPNVQRLPGPVAGAGPVARKGARGDVPRAVSKSPHDVQGLIGRTSCDPVAANGFLRRGQAGLPPVRGLRGLPFLGGPSRCRLGVPFLDGPWRCRLGAPRRRDVASFRRSMGRRFLGRRFLGRRFLGRKFLGCGFLDADLRPQRLGRQTMEHEFRWLGPPGRGLLCNEFLRHGTLGYGFLGYRFLGYDSWVTNSWVTDSWGTVAVCRLSVKGCSAALSGSRRSRDRAAVRGPRVPRSKAGRVVRSSFDRNAARIGACRRRRSNRKSLRERREATRRRRKAGPARRRR